MAKINNIIFGFTICFDLRFPTLFRKLAKMGAEAILDFKNSRSPKKKEWIT